MTDRAKRGATAVHPGKSRQESLVGCWCAQDDPPAGNCEISKELEYRSDYPQLRACEVGCETVSSYGADRVPESLLDPEVGTNFQSKDPSFRRVSRRNPWVSLNRFSM